MSGKKRGYLWGLVLLLCLLFPLTGRTDPVVARSETAQGSPSALWYVRGIEGELTQAQLTVDDQPCTLLGFGGLSQLEGAFIHTTILLDNSLSISQTNRERSKELIRRLIEGHTDGEVFTISTFAQEVTKVAEGSDYQQLLQAAEEITFQDQDAYLIEAVASVLRENSEDTSGAYHRIVLISDGVDDNIAGWTFDELAEAVTSEAYYCPIYTVACVWEKNKTGLKNLAALSRKTQAASYVLDEYEEVSGIAEDLRTDDDVRYFVFDFPLEEKDGTEKTVTLTAQTTQGSYELSHAMTMPGLTEEELEELEARSAQTEAQTQPVEEVPQPILILEEETEEALPMAAPPSFWTRYRFPLIFGGILLLLGILALALSLIRRRQERLRKEDQRYFHAQTREEAGNFFTGDAGRTDPPTQAEGDALKNVPPEETVLSGETVGMWEDFSGRKMGRNLTLTEEDTGRRRRLTLRNEAVLGRDQRCQVVFDGERTVSAMHCRLFRQGDQVFVEDLKSRNGTCVNGEQIDRAAALKNGDRLKLGRLHLLVELE